MTTEYDSKESALEDGIFYIGYKNMDSPKKILEGLKSETKELGWPHSKTVELYKCIHRINAVVLILASDIVF